MTKLASDIIRKVYNQEEMALISWLRKYKLILFAIIVGIALIWGYLRWTQTFTTLIDSIREIAIWFVLVWLVVLTAYIYKRDKAASNVEFKDKFDQGLENWEYYGDWRIEKEDGRGILVVTNSGDGGIANPCRLWRDYIFEFETKIVKNNTSWIIRARDIFNFVMLQCEPDKINPHYRVNGNWVKLDPIPIHEPLPTNKWFGVRVKVSGTRVTVNVTIDSIKREILNETILEPKSAKLTIEQGPSEVQNIIISFPTGSVGFRESHKREVAHFRDLSVRKI